MIKNKCKDIVFYLYFQTNLIDFIYTSIQLNQFYNIVNVIDS